MFVTCPHCQSYVTASVEGTCPVCDRAIPGATREPSPDVAGRSAGFDPPDRTAEYSVNTPSTQAAYTIQPANPAQQALQDFRQHLFAATPRVYATRTLVITNVIVFALMVISTGALMRPNGQMLIDWGSNFGPLTLGGQWWRLLTSTFIHIGIIHLGFNMWVLWDVGHLVERLVGNVGFYLLYFISGLCGSLASVFWNPQVISAGASGAVFGVFGALMGFALLRRDSIPKPMLDGLRGSGLTFLAYNLVFGLSIKGIDMAAHVGGLVAGFVCGLILSQPLANVTPLRRASRNGVALVVGAAAVLLAMFFAPSPPIDLQAAIEEFSAVERKVLSAFDTAAGDYDRGRLTDEEFVTLLENDVITPWHAASERLASIEGLVPPQRQRVSEIVRYTKTREEAWEILIGAVRNQDASKMDEYQAKTAEVQRLLEALNKPIAE